MSTKVYAITTYTKTGRKRTQTFESLSEATRRANAIFATTGIVVGIFVHREVEEEIRSADL